MELQQKPSCDEHILAVLMPVEYDEDGNGVEEREDVELCKVDVCFKA